MTALAFLYRGLTRFTIGDTDFIEGCTYALQLWFLKHAGPRASLFRNTDGSLTTLEQYRRLIEQLNEGEITWDYCDRRQSLPRYTHHHHRRTTLLGPYFIVDYCADRCMRQFSQRQKMVSVHAPIGAIPEFDLSSPQWTALFAVARQEWKTQISYTWFIGPVVKKEYAEWSLEGIAAQWYKKNVNPVELKEFDKAINMFVERFEQNAPMAPTLSTICSLRQKQGEKAREFIQKWRIQCNKMKEPISETQALSLIRKNLAQPLKSLICNAPIKTFTELIEQANSIEEGIEEGDFDGNIAPKYKEDVKKGGKTQLPTHFIANAGIRKDQNYKQDKEVPHKRNMSFSKGDDERKNKHPGWSYDQKFTPLSQSREKILEYLLTKGTIVLPKVSEPPKMMGVNKEKLCKFHRAPGHDTEDCFVLKNII
ncbi:hypothetical protein EJ110_NYTH59959 [Nymphaea thermarum]|nr:hypothetical protein EJ110_NYTH59959 [Nymphaea thermarum]